MRGFSAKLENKSPHPNSLARGEGNYRVITKISGNLLRLDDDSVTLGVEAFEYQVFIAESARRALQGHVARRSACTRFTITTAIRRGAG